MSTLRYVGVPHSSGDDKPLFLVSYRNRRKNGPKGVVMESDGSQLTEFFRRNRQLAMTVYLVALLLGSLWGYGAGGSTLRDDAGRVLGVFGGLGWMRGVLVTRRTERLRSAGVFLLMVVVPTSSGGEMPEFALRAGAFAVSSVTTMYVFMRLRAHHLGPR